MRWLAVHLPDLPLEVFARAHTESMAEAGAAKVPLAVTMTLRGERILCRNRAAAEQGVRPGQGIGAARALCAELRAIPRDSAAEREALERLAAWSIRFTPQVSLTPPRALLLDVAASLHLFGGAERLVERVREGIRGLGYRCRLALAPTPLGALVLARSGPLSGEDRVPPVPDLSALRAALGALPLGALGLTPRELDDLTRMGLRRVLELLRLPRRGLRERLGVERMDWLERLLGEAPDPRPGFDPPARYEGRIELALFGAGEIELAESLVFPCRRLLMELAGFLIGRQAGVRRLDWSLVHADLPDTRFELGAARPLWQPEAWLELLRGRLERLTLCAPVREIRLAAGEPCTLDPTAPEISPDLFPHLPGCGRTPDRTLLDRLRARLGKEAVRGLALVADHRPERAWRWCEPGESGTGIPRADRPLWLLPEPRPLEVRDGRPWLEGPLDLGSERERIDTGWWDDDEVARDYFVATGPRGERLWVYRELKGRRDWYLHGLFG